MNKRKSKKYIVPTLKFNSDWFECRECEYKEMRRVLGPISDSPCPRCGHSPMYRMK